MTINETKIADDNVSIAEYNTIAATINDITDNGLPQKLTFDGTGHEGLVCNSLTSTQRDALIGIEAGAIIYNTTEATHEAYDGSQWISLTKKYNQYYIVSRDDTGDYQADGTADDVQIQAAIDAANSAGGGTVFIKEGTYNCTSKIEPKSNVTIWGAGNNTKLRRGSNIELIGTSSALDDFEMGYLDICDDEFINECINLTSSANDKITLHDLTFTSTADRAIFCAGNVRIFNCIGHDVAQFIGTKNESSSSPESNPQISISNCQASNISFQDSAESEFIEVNAHDLARVEIVNCSGRGFRENFFDINATHFAVTNCHAYCPANSGVYAFVSSVNTGTVMARGSFVNCHVHDLNAGSYGFYFDVMDGVTVSNCTVRGNNSVTPGGTAFFADGGTSKSLQISNVYARDVDVMFNNDMGDTLQIMGYDYDNVTTVLSGNEPLYMIGVDSFYPAGSNESNIWEGFKVRVGGSNPFRLLRSETSTGEYLDITMNDADLAFTYNQDESDGTTHDIVFNTVTSATGNSSFIIQENGNQMFKVNETGATLRSVTTAQRNALTGMEEGTMIFNDDTNKLNFWDGSAWREVTSI